MTSDLRPAGVMALRRLVAGTAAGLMCRMISYNIQRMRATRTISDILTVLQADVVGLQGTRQPHWAASYDSSQTVTNRKLSGYLLWHGLQDELGTAKAVAPGRFPPLQMVGMPEKPHRGILGRAISLLITCGLIAMQCNGSIRTSFDPWLFGFGVSYHMVLGFTKDVLLITKWEMQLNLKESAYHHHPCFHSSQRHPCCQNHTFLV